MKEEDHFTQTQLPALLLHLQLLSLQPFTFSLGLSLLCSLLCSNFAALSWCLFTGKNGATSSSSSSTMVATNLLHLGWVHMVGAAPAAAAAFVNGWCRPLIVAAH